MSEEQVQVKTPEFVSLQFKLAGLGSRATAIIIDQLILSLINFIVVLALFLTSLTSIGGILDSGWLVAAVIIGLFILQWGYFFIFEYFSNGKTVGKRIIGIRVIQENGHSITLLSAFIRNLLRIVDMLPVSYVIGILFIFFNSKHKRLGDMAAGTIVVHERKGKRREDSLLEREINRRGITEDSISVSDFTLNSLGSKEYNLLKTYSYKLLEMSKDDLSQLTSDMAAILLVKVNLEPTGKTDEELENELLALYVNMKKDWEFKL